MAAEQTKKIKLIEFFTQTKREIDKVTWPSKKEIYVTTALILAFAVVMGIFFLAVDGVLVFVISRILGMA
ncbi:MAG: preprotein translocase subunit SecE [Alphaproteobacteria bacterium]|nr:preprotein translocase subunit SecE [Alphaproteobacteria bacterium]MCL2504928.1 preprotein translocase subunit SecE [Alphaproteobacteria bacterium]